MEDASAPGLPVWHYDGRTARKRTPRLIASADGFTLVDELGEDGPIAWASLIAREASGADAVYGLKDRPGWRLGITGAIPPDILAHLPRAERYGRMVDRFGLGRSTTVFLVLAAITVFVVLSAPRWIAPYVPSSWERRLGDAIVGDFGGRLCNGAGGQAALDKLTRRINPKGLPLQVRVANVDMVNAVALPGGKIIIFQELLQEAESADEVAGVLGHEIGHVQHRDVVQALLRQAGLSVLLGGVSGDAGGAFNALLAATYSREAESNADAAAVAGLAAAGISPMGTAGFFQRLAKMEQKLGRASMALSYVASHPLSHAREKVFAGSAVKGRAYTPALTRDEWDALVNICHNDKDVKRGPFFGFD
ncbi:M48 family metallopeptidase [Sphingobium boeckii]|uniref:Zn-dependent protease with chaperone function n=1 Tax=Sphingobium boeckii TaxID=1082345 RepID=A0A7W9AES3_9SPHN|nr:M48 family metallopeptidase [Sphingobium boeckii]MBB5684352.1 Zn-dependent protease with chaperone function [Sphingobium boeckii]